MACPVTGCFFVGARGAVSLPPPLGFGVRPDAPTALPAVVRVVSCVPVFLTGALGFTACLRKAEVLYFVARTNNPKPGVHI